MKKSTIEWVWAGSKSDLFRALTRALVGLSLLLAASTPAYAATTFDDNVTPDVIFGTGNPNGLFTVDRSAGVELGLRAKIPFIGAINSNGDGTYSYTLAELLAADPSQRWNFDWTVNTDHLGSSGDKIDDLTYLLQIDFDPSAGTDFLEFDPITPNVAPLFAPFFDHSIGDNTTPNGGGAEATDGPTYLALITANNAVQQSWRHAFFPFHPTLTYDPTIPGTYDIVLSAFDGSSILVASTSIQVIISCDSRYVSTTGIDTSNDCLDAGTPCLTIQHAVDEAGSCDTINVAAGSYDEQVRIDKSLSLVGAGKATTTIGAPPKASRVDEVADHGFGSRTYDYLLGVFGTGTETVNISGFTLDGKFDAKISGPSPFRSQQLTFLNASGTIEANSLIDWQDPAAFGVQGVATLVIGSLTAETVVVRDNMISGYQKGGIVAFGTGAVMVTIEDNMVTGAGPITTTAQNGIQISSGAGGSIIGNESTDANFTPATFCSAGILIFAVDNITVRNNFLTGNLCDLLAITNDSTIEGNEIPAALDFPFSVIGDGNIVDKNQINGTAATFEGVYVDGIDNVLTCNRITNNDTGIFFDVVSTAGTPNTANDNVIEGNASAGIDAISVVALPPVDGRNNYWGCATGANTLGCDTAVGNVDFTPSLAAEPLCATCAGAGGDTDADGVCDPVDNCPLVANGSQDNADGDSFGDVCDVCPLDADNDIDGDTVCGDVDNCPGDANLDQSDVDGDNIGDVCDGDDGIGSTVLSRVKLKAAKVGAPSPRGKVIFTVLVRDDQAGNFLPNDLTVSGDVRFEVAAGPFAATLNMGTCTQKSTRLIACSDGNVKARFKLLPQGSNIFPNTYKVTAKLKRHTDTDSPIGPVSVTLRQPTTSIDRTDDIAACVAKPRRLSCREQ